MAASTSVKDEERQKLMDGEEVPAKKSDDKKDGTRWVENPSTYPGQGEAGFMQFPCIYKFHLFGWESTTASGSASDFSCSSSSISGFSALIPALLALLLRLSVWPL